MLHKKKLLITLILIIIGLVGAIMFYLNINSYTGTITQNFSETTDNRSTIGVHGSKDEILTFKLISEIKEGDVQFQILDSEENLIGVFGQDIAEQEVLLEKDDTYEIAAISESLVGNFRLKVYKK
ncbi:MAG: hypothetical protein ACRC3H_00800 [Lachnospiraceae bacterium]